MTDSKNNIPRWLLIVTFLFALLEFGVSLSLFIAPASVLETVDFNAKGVTELAHM
ncbi:MAG TPA: hypothetical protein PLP34_00125 [Chitinophagaceae bacterium]|nr:hypothetical protein [Chitinophagaceae bacterium]